MYLIFTAVPPVTSDKGDVEMLLSRNPHPSRPSRLRRASILSRRTLAMLPCSSRPSTPTRLAIGSNQGEELFVLHLARTRPRELTVAESQLDERLGECDRCRPRVDDRAGETVGHVGTRLMHRRRAEHDDVCAVLVDCQLSL